MSFLYKLIGNKFSFFISNIIKEHNVYSKLKWKFRILID